MLKNGIHYFVKLLNKKRRGGIRGITGSDEWNQLKREDMEKTERGNQYFEVLLNKTRRRRSRGTKLRRRRQ